MFNPLIGITCGEDELNFFVKQYYVKAVEFTGGVPLLLPPVQYRFSEKKYLDVLDGIILSGGVDVDPVFFGEEPAKGMGEITPARDEFEIHFTQEFFQTKKPIFAVCRGLQVLNISLGGTIFQDINSEHQGTLKHQQHAPRWWATHSVKIAEGTKLSTILPGNQWRVNSFHHQAVKSPAPGFCISALAQDGIIEAIEGEHHPFAVGVQWHPECNWENDMGSYRLFQAFITACKA